jgi:hypothetical protein
VPASLKDKAIFILPISNFKQRKHSLLKGAFIYSLEQTFFESLIHCASPGDIMVKKAIVSSFMEFII